MPDQSNNLEELYKEYNSLIKQGYSFESPKLINVLKQIYSIKSSQLKNNQNNSLKNNHTVYEQLIKEGYSFDSPEMINYFKNYYKQNSSFKKTDETKKNKTISNNSNNIARTKNTSNIKNTPCHFIIDTLHGNYTLLDNNLKIIDEKRASPVKHFFFRGYYIRKFKKTIKNDYKKLKKQCTSKQLKSSLKKIKCSIKKINFYLWLCPDADYTILILLKKHISKLNPSCRNYIYACEKYLKELANYNKGNAQNLPFDITLASTDGKTSNNHRFISTCIALTDNPVQDFIKNIKTIDSHSNSFHDNYVYSMKIKQKNVNEHTKTKYGFEPNYTSPSHCSR